MSPDHRSRLADLLKERSVSHGDFVLASGARSTIYVDCRRTTFHPLGAWLVGRVLEPHVATMNVDSVGGLTLGADPVSMGIAIASQEEGRPVRVFTVRKESKGHGQGRKIEGSFESGDRVLVIEDVVTSGGSALKAIEAVQAAGATVVGVAALVDREEGGRDRLEAEGVPLHAVFRLRELTDEQG